MKTLKEYSETELKALAFDNIAQIETSQNNLKLINQELAERSKEVEVVKAEKVK